MAFTGFHHGTRLEESAETPVLVRTADSSVIGLVGTAPDADETDFPANTPVLLPGDATLAQSLGATGTLFDAIEAIFDQGATNVVVVRVEEGADTAETISAIVGTSIGGTGLHALKLARELLGVQPRIIIAPGFTTADNTAVLAELPAILQDLEAVALMDAPSAIATDAIAFRANIASERIKLLWPGTVRVWDTGTSLAVQKPTSPYFAGVMAHVDRTRGFWVSESNKPINGIMGADTPVGGIQADLLNENEVATIVNHGAGYVTWGNRGCGAASLTAFFSVRRTMDFINGAIRDAFLEFVDRPFSAANIRLMVASANSALWNYKNEGAIIGGKCWFDATRNDPTQMADGKITLSIKFEPPAPMEDIRFIAYRDIDYYLDLVREAAAAA
ncbi:phage tail sheath subtilisin-like domain-containing protein [Tropicimonas sp. IMCC34043]|uniref:phage tail sheath subtilisin-like domain-containing protein n=1 Tax=Tropicimonas sp. IMCC34043 TaxID=2248760 RepID=UPI000E24035F|nr:phage tail sheath subtilisin-like domain-containing protein [Tropicimonas sp. IMCC34043]